MNEKIYTVSVQMANSCSIISGICTIILSRKQKHGSNYRKHNSFIDPISFFYTSLPNRNRKWFLSFHVLPFPSSWSPPPREVMVHGACEYHTLKHRYFRLVMSPVSDTPTQNSMLQNASDMCWGYVHQLWLSNTAQLGSNMWVPESDASDIL